MSAATLLSRPFACLFAFSMFALTACDGIRPQPEPDPDPDPNLPSPALACGGMTGKACPAPQFCKYPISAQCGAADALGMCSDRPTVCDGLYQPVCGCNGITYANQCAADAEGISVVAQGTCDGPTDPSGGIGKACGGMAGLQCQANLFCKYPQSAQCGAADALGACTAYPTECSEEYNPVCGCDNKTYGNPCAADSAGISVAYPGTCKNSGAEGQTCTQGGPSCQTGLFCKLPQSAACGDTDKVGICSEMPKACNQLYDPVCGCDGTTFTNACFADGSGVSIRYKGACKAQGNSGDACGGIQGGTCKEMLFCEYPLSAQCGQGDALGMCTVPPDVCPKDYRPVCGCDNNTYSNACFAQAARVSVKSEGECKKQEGKAGQSCGSRGMAPCEAGLFCFYEPQANCGATDLPGTCQPRPENCTEIYQPVCGCDGKTYSNRCKAQEVGVSIRAAGGC